MNDHICVMIFHIMKLVLQTPHGTETSLPDLSDIGGLISKYKYIYISDKTCNTTTVVIFKSSFT